MFRRNQDARKTTGRVDGEMIDPFALNEAPVGEPLSLTIGQSAQWRRIINIDSSVFTLTYVLRDHGPGDGHAHDYQITMAPTSAGEFAADVLPTDITDWHSGHYFWDLIITRISDGRTKIIETGTIHVFGDNDERRSHAQIMIDKIESVLENRADSDVESYTIKSRSITKMSAKDLREWRDYYIREMANRPGDVGMFQVEEPKKNTLRVRFRD